MTDIGEPTGHDPAPFTTDDCRCPACLKLEAKVFFVGSGAPAIGQVITWEWSDRHDFVPKPLHPLQAITDQD